MATKIATLKENGDTVYPLTKVECVYNDSNQNVSDLLTAQQTQITNKADVDASNLSSANVDSWISKLKDINLVAHVVTTSLTNAITITGLNIISDGGVYDVYIKGSTSNGSLQWLKMNNVDLSQVAYGRNGTWVTERQDGAIGLFSDYQSHAICTIYKPNNGYGIVTYKSFSYNSSQHEFATGSALYVGDGTSIRIYINGNKNFPIGSEVYVYRR